MSKKILLFGGLGYLGSVINDLLTKKGHEVWIVDNRLYGQKEPENFIFGDVRYPAKAFEEIGANIDCVVNFAAIVGEPACYRNPKFSYDVNYVGAVELAKETIRREVPHHIFASTCSVYGMSDPNGTATEDSPLAPLGIYAEAKVKAEQEILSMNSKGTNITVLRLSTVFGPSRRMRFDLVANLLMAKAVYDHEISIFGGNQWRPFIYTKDVAKAVNVAVNKQKHGVFNTGGNQNNITIMELGKKIQSLVKGTALRVDGDKEDDRSYKVSFDRIQSELGFEPDYSIDRGLLELRERVMANEFPNPFDAIYRN